MEQKKIGEFIAALRKENKMTQVELGERLGVTNKTVSRWENGNYLPDISVMQQLCDEFEININELLSGQRLNDESFRSCADMNIIESLNEQKRLKRRKVFTDFLEGGGTGILVSVLYAQDGIRRNVMIGVAIIMILAGWYSRSSLNRRFSLTK